MFHTWRSFSFDENTETIDAYVTCIRQVASLLGYGEPQILEVFKSPLPTKLYWILFSIEDLRQAGETAKRILTKEKMDRQLSGQSLSTPFMSIRDSHNRKVSFDTKEELGDKIDKLRVMIGKLATRDSGAGRQFKLHIYQGRGRGQNRGNYDRCSYDQQSYQNKYRSDSADRRQYRQDRGRPRYEQNYRRGNFRGNTRNFDRGENRNNYRNKGYDRSRNRSRERSFSRNFSSNRNMSTSNSRSRSGLRASMNRDRKRYYKCREYDHFAKYCPTCREDKEIEQLQQMLNLEDEKTALKSLVTNTQDNFSRVNSEGYLRLGHLNF